MYVCLYVCVCVCTHIHKLIKLYKMKICVHFMSRHTDRKITNNFIHTQLCSCITITIKIIVFIILLNKKNYKQQEFTLLPHRQNNICGKKKNIFFTVNSW